MKKLCFILAFAALFQTGFSQTKNFIDQPYLETAAEMDTLVAPDRIYLRIRLQESDSRGRTSLESLEREMGKGLEKLGINLEKQLTVSDLGSEFQKYFLRKQDILKEKVFELVLYDAQTTGRVLVELEKAGISNIQLLKTEYAEMGALEDILRVRAVKKAKRQGVLIAEALGQALGPAIHISERGIGVYNRFMEQGAVLMAAESKVDYTPLPADFDQIRVQMGLQAKFKLE
jgi:uncharacterized protein YggE